MEEQNNKNLLHKPGDIILVQGFKCVNIKGALCNDPHDLRGRPFLIISDTAYRYSGFALSSTKDGKYYPQHFYHLNPGMINCLCDDFIYKPNSLDMYFIKWISIYYDYEKIGELKPYPYLAFLNTFLYYYKNLKGRELSELQNIITEDITFQIEQLTRELKR